MIDKTKLQKCEVIKMMPIIEDDKLFVKSGITVLSALAGTGKSTYMKIKTKEFEKNNFNCVYFNADLADIEDSYILPDNIKDFGEILKEADENDIVIIDSLKMFCAKYNLDVMDNSDMIKLFLDLRNIVSKNKCSVIFVHHSFKEKKLKNADEHLFGARAIEEQSDSVFLYDVSGNMKVIKNRLGLIRGSIFRDETLDDEFDKFLK